MTASHLVSAIESKAVFVEDKNTYSKSETSVIPFGTIYTFFTCISEK